MKFLTDKIAFPDVSEATEEGILAVGGDLSSERLILAYNMGIFPWFEEHEPIMWWSPDPRFVLFPEKLKISKSMKQTLRNNTFRITINNSFKDVVFQCASIKRDSQNSTWITQNMIEAYCNLHDLGYAISVEVWHNTDLVGGIYGVDVGNNIFCGESMFSKVNNASKVGLINFIQSTNYRIFDCQVYTKHLDSLGAEYIDRIDFMKLLK